MTDIDIDRAAELYRGGMTIKQVAAEFAVSITTIRKRLIDAGEKMRRYTYSKVLADDVEKAAAMYRSGASLRRIAVDLDVSHETVRKRLKSGGTAVRRHGHNSRRSASLRPMTPANQQAS